MMPPLRTIVCSLAVCAATAGVANGQIIGAFVPTGSMSFSRTNHTETRLPDGTILIAGGCGAPAGESGCVALRSAERYDPAAGAFLPAGDMTQTRYGHTATLLENGTVLIAGGVGTDIASAEIFDPATGLFTPTGSMIATRFVNTPTPSVVAGRSFHTATRLNDGRVLLTGGQAGGAISDAEIFDPSTGTFLLIDGDCAVLGGCTMIGPRYLHSATLLEDGTVLIVGGLGGAPFAAELYVPSPVSHGSFRVLAYPNTLRWGHTATRLLNGKVLIAGGNYVDDQGMSHGLWFADIYDPATGAASFVLMQSPRSQHSATLLPFGNVLLIGGVGDTGPQPYADEFDPGSSAFFGGATMAQPRYGHTATLLDDGKVVVAGGAGVATPSSWTAETFEGVPHANDGMLSVVEDTPTTGTLTATAPPGTVLTFHILSSHPGVATLTDPLTGAFTYTPYPDYYGQSFLTFEVISSFGESNVGTITVNIAGVDDAPVAVDGWLTTPGRAAASGQLRATDYDGPAMAFSIVANGTKGTATITNAATGAFTYTPAPTASGTDSFTFSVSDGTLDSNVATVHVSIDEPPVASSGAIAAIQNEAAGGILAATDPDSPNTLSFSIVSNGTKGTATVVSSSGLFRYTPLAGSTGMDSFTFKVNDGLVDSNVATITVAIRTPPQGFEALHSFTEASVSRGPLALGIDGNLYGVSAGGSGDGGSIYRLMPAGLEEIIFRFPASVPGSSAVYPLGCHPIGKLAQTDTQTLYGVASGCGEHDGGTLFTITLGGVFTKLYDFASGSQPSGGVAVYYPFVYGTTQYGGDANLGTVFRYLLNGTGTLNTLHSFTGPDGQWPVGDITLGFDGTVYGTTRNGGCGGLNGCSDAYNGPGTIFRVATDGTFTLLHAFSWGPGSVDGANPLGGLVESFGALYGTAPRGGTSGNGIVFRLAQDGTLKRLHDFSGADSIPAGGLLKASDGNFYGAVIGTGPGPGSLFRITPNGSFAPVHAFSGADGRQPTALTQGADGRLYGSTAAGGTQSFGTLFSLPIPASVNILADNWPASFPGFEPLRIAISAHSASGVATIDPAVMYIGVQTPFGLYWLNSSFTLGATPSPVRSEALPTFGPSTLFWFPNSSALPKGTYTWFIAVVNGGNVLFDSVQTIIQ